MHAKNMEKQSKMFKMCRLAQTELWGAVTCSIQHTTSSHILKLQSVGAMSAYTGL